jgi:hypothetical protein
VIFDQYTWKGSTLISRADTIASIAARKFFGDVWKETTTAFDIGKEIDTTVDVDKELTTDNNGKEKDKEKQQ